MTCSPATPAMPPRLRDRNITVLNDRDYARYRRDYWREKQRQADEETYAPPMRRQIEARLALCDVTYGRNGGVWV